MTVLLDGNVLIAVTFSSHVHHPIAARLLSDITTAHATSPITQGTLLRSAIRLGATPSEAVELLESLTMSAHHVFWADTEPYTRFVLRGVAGHADVTNAYLAALARHHDGRLATFDRRLGTLHPDVVDVIRT
jgi:uncharacterized protein